MSFEGRWRIVDMELWDKDAIDLVGPGFIEIVDNGQGRFRFIAVEGWMDIRDVEREGRAGIEFSWGGNDESDPRQRPRLGNAVARRLSARSDLCPHGRRLLVPSVPDTSVCP